MTERHFVVGLYAVTLLGCSIICVVTLQRQGLHADDAWMFVRYADHWLQNGAWSWNPGGSPTFGITSLSHLALVTFGRTLGLGHTPCLQLVVLAPALLLVVLALRESFWRLGERTELHILACALVLYLVLTANFRVHLTSGMDTLLGVLAAFLLVRSALQLQERLNLERAIAFHAATLLAVLTRPEMALLAACYSVGTCVTHRGEKASVASLVLLPQVALAGIGIGSLWFYFGTPIPYTLLAKSPGHYHDLVGSYDAIPMRELKLLAMSFAPLFVSLLAFPPHRRALLFVLPAQLLLIAFTFRIVWVMGYEGRFYMPVVGALVFLAIDGLERGSRETRAYRVQSALAVLAGLALAALLWKLAGPRSVAWGLCLSAGLATAWRLRGTGRSMTPVASMCVYLVLAQSSWTQERRGLKRSLADTQPFFVALAENLRPLDSDLKIAATEHGYLGAENSNKSIVDLAGLHDPVFARQFDVDRLFDQEPDLILMPRWVYRGMIQSIENDERFVRDYRYMSNVDADVAAACSKEKIGVAIRLDEHYSGELEAVVQRSARRALGKPDRVATTFTPRAGPIAEIP